MQTTATLPLAWIHGVKHRLSMHGHVEHVGLYLLRRLEPELGQAAPPSLPPSLSLSAVRSTTSASASARICTSTTRGAAAAVSWGALQASTLPTTELHRQGENAATATLRTLPLRLRAPSPAAPSHVLDTSNHRCDVVNRAIASMQLLGRQPPPWRRREPPRAQSVSFRRRIPCHDFLQG